uniref:Uncharacterized protein n=1 Tax=Rhizophora mucronata TaxID=61149 RepID=A0A2P2LT43_RHIMU
MCYCYLLCFFPPFSIFLDCNPSVVTEVLQNFCVLFSFLFAQFISLNMLPVYGLGL